MNLIASQRCLPWNFSLACGSVRVGDGTRASLFVDAPLSSSGNSVFLVCAQPMLALFTLRHPLLSSLPWNVTERDEDRNHLPRGNCSGEIEFLDERELAEVESPRWRFHNGNSYMFTQIPSASFISSLASPIDDITSLSVVKSICAQSINISASYLVSRNSAIRRVLGLFCHWTIWRSIRDNEDCSMIGLTSFSILKWRVHPGRSSWIASLCKPLRLFSFWVLNEAILCFIPRSDLLLGREQPVYTHDRHLTPLRERSLPSTPPSNVAASWASIA